MRHLLLRCGLKGATIHLLSVRMLRIHLVLCINMAGLLLALRVHYLQIGLLVEEEIAVGQLHLRNVLVGHLALATAARLEHEVLLVRQALRAGLVLVEHGSQQQILAARGVDVVDQPR